MSTNQDFALAIGSFLLGTGVACLLQQQVHRRLSHRQRQSSTGCNHTAEGHPDQSYSLPDQPQRYAIAKRDYNPRVMNIEAVYKPGFLRDKTVLVTGKSSSSSPSLQ